MRSLAVQRWMAVLALIAAIVVSPLHAWTASIAVVTGFITHHEVWPLSVEAAIARSRVSVRAAAIDLQGEGGGH